MSGLVLVALPFQLALVVFQVTAAGAGAGVAGVPVVVVMVLQVVMQVVMVTLLGKSFGDVVLEFVNVIPKRERYNIS